VNRFLFASLTALLLLAGCAGAGPKSGKIRDPRADLVTDRTAKGPDGEKHQLTGEASWYGEKFHGQQTANGETYDMYGFTAAHKTLPFHTVVRVTDPLTRKSVVVRITDRGPYVDGRIIDLSWAAASDLDMDQHGVITVEVEVLRWGDGSRVSTQ
jgi:rare lipoprotein A (peptidoglycan hydrolase)